MSEKAIMHVALLRGVNVGGKNKLPMKSLAQHFADAGAAEVQTYIQSGNVIFRAARRRAGSICAAVAAAIHGQLGLAVPVVVRSAEELDAAIAANPFVGAGADEATLHVGFLELHPAGRLSGALDPDRSPGDSFRIVGREIFLHLPGGVARSKLTNAWFDSRLKTISTFRNWRTTLKLAELVRAGA